MTHGFPVPTTDRDEIVNESLEWLKEKNVWSRGRFGAFKYEVGGADHCFIQVWLILIYVFTQTPIRASKPWTT